MKKKLIITLILAILFCTACGKSEDKKDADNCYLTYAPLTIESNEMLYAVNATLPDSATVEFLKFKPVDNNVAIVRVETSKEDGTWEVEEEKKIILSNKEYMAYINSPSNYFSIGTSDIEEEFTAPNRAVLQYPKKTVSAYATSKMFTYYTQEDLEKMHDMDEEESLAYEAYHLNMSQKKPIEIGFQYEVPLIESDGKLTTYDDASPDADTADIEDIYENKNNKFTGVYKAQDMYAVTVEFVQDDDYIAKIKKQYS